MLDLRAPIEFAQGAFSNATNIPLLTDSERELIGTCYKQQGQDKAIKLGHEIVSGDIKLQRIQAWRNYFHENPSASLYCFRGGMRSHLVQEWLRDEGTDVPLIKGGYKALRGYLLNVLEHPHNLMRISGQTGVGKTDLLLQMQHMIDLEGLANHRGSAFGKCSSEQPSQIDFENNLAVEIIKQTNDYVKPILIEDESRYIGSINIPHIFMETLASSQVLILTCPQQERINRIYQEYVVKQKQEYLLKNAEIGSELFNNSLLSALFKIQKRLGGARFKQINSLLQQALKLDSESLHKQWISDLLKLYYDPMYAYQLENKSDKIIFTGDKADLKQFIFDKIQN